MHMGIAQQYQIPVISYAEAMFHDYYRLMDRLRNMDDHTYSFPDDMWMEDGGLGIDPSTVSDETPIASAIFPFPHGCAKCRPQHIESQFRKGHCKSICRFLKHGNLIPGSNLICNDNDGPFPKGRNECFVPFFAHDEVHPSALGHAIVADFIVDMLAMAQFRTCEYDDSSLDERDALPLTTFVADSFEELKVRGDFLWVHDVDRYVDLILSNVENTNG